jgi:hypothetical protein
MKKKIIAGIIISLLFISGSYAQIRFGIRGGVNSSTFKADEVISTTDGLKITYPKDSRMGFHFGLISQIKLFNVFIQPEMLLTTNKNTVSVEDLTTHTTKILDQTFNKLDIPILAGMKFGPAKIELGPVASFLLKNKTDLLEGSTYKAIYNKATFGYQAGVGLEVSKLTVDFKYEGNLSKMGSSIKIGDKPFNTDSRMSQFIVSVGIFF